MRRERYARASLCVRVSKVRVRFVSFLFFSSLVGGEVKNRTIDRFRAHNWMLRTLFYVYMHAHTNSMQNQSRRRPKLTRLQSRSCLRNSSNLSGGARSSSSSQSRADIANSLGVLRPSDYALVRERPYAPGGTFVCEPPK